MKNILRVCLVQMQIEKIKPETNIAKAEDYIIKAKDNKSDLIIFPELFITGPIIGHLQYADINFSYKKLFQKLAYKYQIDIVPGTIIERRGGDLFNISYYINYKGKVLLEYKKINLWLPEKPYISPGHQINICDTRFGKCGIIICWDIISPVIFRKLINQDVNFIICPSFWGTNDRLNKPKYNPDGEVELVNSICKSKAIENGVTLLYCNAAGTVKYGGIIDTLIGQSQITQPFMGCIKKLDHNREGMLVETIDTSVNKVAEDVYKIRNDLSTNPILPYKLP